MVDIFRRVYGDQASLFRASLPRISHPNKLPLIGFLRSSCLGERCATPIRARILNLRGAMDAREGLSSERV